MRFIDLNGRRFGRWVVIGRDSVCRSRDIYWLCKCNCGRQVSVKGAALRSGASQSCGCLHSEKTSERSKTHGLRHTAEYRIWSLMKDRCENKNGPRFHLYGGRGICVCDRWLNSFEAFIQDMGMRPSSGHSIERVDVNGNYCPDNCVWATSKVQSRNRRNNRLLTIGGKTKCLAAWAEEVGISPSLLAHRLRAGWPIEKAIKTKVAKSSRLKALA